MAENIPTYKICGLSVSSQDSIDEYRESAIPIPPVKLSHSCMKYHITGSHLMLREFYKSNTKRSTIMFTEQVKQLQKMKKEAENISAFL